MNGEFDIGAQYMEVIIFFFLSFSVLEPSLWHHNWFVKSFSITLKKYVLNEIKASLKDLNPKFHEPEAIFHLL